MKRKILFLSFIFIAFCTKAQILDVVHPPNIMGQEQQVINMGETIEVTPEMLIIHDMDDNSVFEVNLQDGENYTFDGNLVTPSADFSGVLHISLSVNDGRYSSSEFDFLVTVKSNSTQVNEYLVSQDKLEIKHGKAYEVISSDVKLFALPETSAVTYYVAPDGKDSNDGSKNAPLKTLAGAKSKIQSYKNSNSLPADGITVYFREGDYFNSSTTIFGKSDSGEKDKYITYRAFPGETVRFTGSKKINFEDIKDAPDSFTKKIKDQEAAKKIKMVDLKALGITSLGEISHIGYGVKGNPLTPANLFIDGVAMHLCRYPNVGNLEKQTIDGQGPLVSSNGTKIFTPRDNVATTWENTGDIWVDGPLSKAWEWQKNNISSISDNGTIVMKYDYVSDIIKDECKFFFYNVVEELDYPGEFYIDRDKGILYVYLPDDVDENSDIRMSQSENTIVKLTNASYLQFKDIYFEGSRKNLLEIRDNSTHNNIVNCDICDCGGDAIYIDGYDNHIINCRIHDIGSKGIHLDGGNSSTLAPARNLVENCVIHDFSQEFRAYHPGLEIRGVGQVVRHVELYNGPHMAIDIKGNDHILEYNDLHDAPKEYSDMLAVYLNTGGNMGNRGTIIRHNKFHDVSGTWKQSAGVYMDNETSGVLVEKNYFYDNVAWASGWSVEINGGADNIIRKNVFFNCSTPFGCGLRLNGYAAASFDGRLEAWGPEIKGFSTSSSDKHLYYYPELKRYFDNNKKTPYPMTYEYVSGLEYYDRRTPWTNSFSYNLGYNQDKDLMSLPNESSTTKVFKNEGFSISSIYNKFGDNIIHENNHFLNKDIGFVDAEKRDLNFLPGSEAVTYFPYLKDMGFDLMGIVSKTGVTYSDFIINSNDYSISIADENVANCTISDGKILPNDDFIGILSIPLKITVGDKTLDYNLKINVLEGVSAIKVPSKKAIYIYPNPCENEIHVTGHSGSDIRIYNSLGRLIYTEQKISDNGVVGVSEYPSGLYFVVISKEGEKDVRSKFIKK